MNRHFDTAGCGFQGYFAGRVQLGQIAAVYCRVSTNDQNCKRQETDLIAFAEKAGYVVVGVWKETGSGSKVDRQQRQQVLSLAQTRKIDVILGLINQKNGLSQH